MSDGFGHLARAYVNMPSYWLRMNGQAMKVMGNLVQRGGRAVEVYDRVWMRFWDDNKKNDLIWNVDFYFILG